MPQIIGSKAKSTATITIPGTRTIQAPTNMKTPIITVFQPAGSISRIVYQARA